MNHGVSVGGALVTEYAWPSDTVLAGLHKNDTVPLVVLGSVRTGADGRYATAANLATLGASYRQADGAVDIETYVYAGSKSTQYRTILPSAELSARVLDAESFDLGADTVQDTRGIRSGTSALAVGVNRAAKVTPNVPNPPAPYCYTKDTGGRSQRAEIYGQQNGSYGVWGSMAEIIGTDHSVEIAIEYDGGAWTASGSASSEVKSGGTASVAKHGYSQQNVNTLNIYQYYSQCEVSGHVTSWSYQWNAINTAGLNTDHRPVPHPYYSGECFNQAKGDTQTAGKGVVVSISGGMSIHAVSLTVKDTFETSVQDNFQWTLPGEFCGDSTAGPSQSQHVEGDDNPQPQT